MKRALKYIIILVVVAGLGTATCRPILKNYQERNRPQWRTAKVSRGEIYFDVRATGTVKPVLSVSVGSFVSGPISELYADFNQEVKKDDLLARVDPRIYMADVARDEAALATRQADVERVKALLQQARRNEARAVSLRKENENFLSPKEMDAFHFERMSLEAQLKVSEAAVKQSQGALENSQANLAYTEIRSPVDGIIIDRKIDRGQTLAALFQTPELFIVAPDMEKKMYVFATIDEADIGLILQAQAKNLPVEFRVDAYPDDTFTGTIEQVRKNSTTTENVVTYPVVVAAPNPEMKLLPGMTASLSFQVDQRDDVLRVPNAALRFYPLETQTVRPEDREILTGKEDEAEIDISDAHLTAEEQAELKENLHHRHVWKQEGEFLRAISIETGLSDMKYTEVVSGELDDGDELVVGVK